MSGERTEPGMSGESWYVYCVVGAPAGPLDRLRVITEAGLGAVVAPVPTEEFEDERLRENLRDLDWVTQLALEHAGVLDRLLPQAVVVPMRICTVYRTEERVRGMLSREAVRFRTLLAQLDGRSEWGVKVSKVREPALEPVASPVTDSGAAYLLARRRERDLRAEADERIDQACGEIHELLCAAAGQGAVNPPQRQKPGEMVLNGVYLVPDDHVGRFHHQVRELGERFESLGLDLVTTGPWPAYNFVPEDVGVQA